MAVDKTPTAKCGPFIPVYPFRYSARPKEANEPADPTWKEAGLTKLESGFPALKHSRYNLRLIDDGHFVYVFDVTDGKYLIYVVRQGLFTEVIASGKPRRDPEFKSKDKGIEGFIEDGIPYNKGFTHNFIPVCAKKGAKVYLMTTDALLTQRMAGNILHNIEGLRDKLTTEVIGSSWDKGNPAKHTFPFEKAKSKAGVIDEINGANLSFSPYKAEMIAGKAEEIYTAMQTYARGYKSEGKEVAVALFDNYALTRDLQEAYFKKAKKVDNYVGGETPNAKKRQRMKIIAEAIEQLYLMNYTQKTEIKDPTPEKVEQRLNTVINERYANQLKKGESLKPEIRQKERAKILAGSAGNLSRHVREAERAAFLAAYRAEFNRLYQEVIEAKNDWAALLETFTKRDSPTHLGATFLRYDLKNEVTSSCFALHFASATVGMLCSSVNLPAGVIDKARNLYMEWMDKEGAENPIFANIENDKGFGFLEEKPFDVKAAGEKAAGKADTFTVASAAAIKSIMSYQAINILLAQVTVYEASGAAFKAGDAKRITAFLKKISAKTDEVIKYLKTKKGIKEHLQEMKITRAEAMEAMKAGLPERPQLKGSLHPQGGSAQKITYYTWGNAPDATEWMRKAVSASKIGAGIAGFFAIKNLNTTMQTFSLEGGTLKNWEESFNLLYAMFSVGSVASAGAEAWGLNVELPKRLTKHTAVRTVAKFGTTRIFGYGSAIFDGGTYAMKAIQANGEGNTDAATSYAFAALALAAGGAALTKATLVLGMASGVATIPFAGWLVAGVILLGVGIVLVVQGDSAGLTEINYWLNDSTWGKNEMLSSRLGAIYKDLEQEEEALVKAINKAQKDAKDVAAKEASEEAEREAMSKRNGRGRSGIGVYG